MIELNRHIEILLLNNDCVIVPNFGGFLTHYVSARFDEADNLFLPPLRTIGFNPQLKINDHLLVQSYVETYDISYPEALRRIESEVEELRQHLENEGMYELNDLGTLKINEDGNYEFIPCEAGILTPSLYGFGTFELIPLQEEAKTETIVPVVSEHAIIEELPEDESQQNENIEVVAIDDDDKNNAIVIKMSWVRNMVATAVAILLFFFITTPIENSEIQTDIQQSSFLSMPKMENEPVSEQTIAEEAVTDSISTVEKAPAIEKALEVTPEYTICLASQTTRYHAEIFVKKMEKSGISDVRIVKMNNMDKVRVVCGSFNTDEEAHERLHQYRASHDEFSDAWVLHVND